MFYLRKFTLRNHPCCISNLKYQINKLHQSNINNSKFQSILIANRGEIACRIIKAAKDMGIKTIAVYSTADVFSKHVKLADDAFCIGHPPSGASYLNIEKLLEIVRITGAEAVHPGYGFLSENADFVQLLESENITFIGPSSYCVSVMGDKLKAKELATNAGVSTVPGYDGIIRNPDECAEISERIGYPVMIKACNGGGGKGMRIITNCTEARAGFELSTQEALSSFGDDRILIEKFIQNPRHIEIQILGDKHGNIIHLNERECSIQRRNQKIIEEAPSPFLDEPLRNSMANQAVALCKQINYHSAGTVEFLLDSERNFYFLEMNTRLQVEHGVTESVIEPKIDLVQEMIRIAQGEPLKIKQEDIRINGWAIESRINAEDPYRSFGLPTAGQLYEYKEPCLDGTRCDSGVEEGCLVNIYYDSLISKLICSGSTRKEAIDKSIKALDSYVIFGVSHNIPLLRDILEQERFVNGEINTNYLAELYSEGFKGYKLSTEQENKLLTIAVGVYIAHTNRENPENISMELVANLQDKQVPVTALCGETHLRVKLNDEEFKIKKISLGQTLIQSSINDQEITMQLYSKSSTGEIRLIYQGTTYTVKILPKRIADYLKLIPKKIEMATSKIIKPLMPGLLKTIYCKVGDTVLEGQQLCIVEAMKMQNSIVSTTNGKIKQIYFKIGDSVGDDDVLFELE